MTYLRSHLALGILAFATQWTSAAVVTIGPHHFTIPDGFTIELVAGSQVVPRPVSASLDDQGRLYVTDSSGSNINPEEQLKDPKGRILRLEDTDGDGKYDKVVVFAERVMFPQGCLWHQGAVYVAGPPSIWRFRDTNGDGMADEREEWFKGGTLTRCANDIHGPYLGPDGYIYWTKGAFAEQTHARPGKKTIHDRAAHIYRSRPDGSDLDVVMSGGMDNPVEVAFTAEGEPIFTSTFIDFSQPGFRDGIGHAVYGGVFGKQNDVLEDGRVVRTSPEVFHPFVQLGAGAACGLCRYQGAELGAEFRDNLFATTFNLHKVTRHRLQAQGASFSSINSDFVVSDNPDFHPTDVMEDVDGSLLIVDTGGWYKVCCPSSQLAKADVLGGIYRVRRQGTILRRDAARLTAALPSGVKALAALAAQNPPSDRTLPAVWGLFRDGSEAALAELKKGIRHADPSVRRASAKALALSGKSSGVDWIALLANPDPAMRRIAAEQFARNGSKKSAAVVAGLLKLAATAKDDVVLEHEAIYALTQIGDVAALRTLGLKASDPAMQRAACIALDQGEGHDLKATDAGMFLTASDSRLRSVARWIARRHPDWADALVDTFRARLLDSKIPAAEKAEWENELGLLVRSPSGQMLLETLIREGGAREQTRLAALQAVASAQLNPAPKSWAAAVASVLPGLHAAPLVEAALKAAKLWSAQPEIASALAQVASDATQPAAIRLQALAASPKGGHRSDAELELIEASLPSSRPVLERSLAAEAISKSSLSAAQLNRVAGWIASAGPLELPKLLGAFDVGGDESMGERLLEALKHATAGSTLRAEVLMPHLKNFPPSVQAGAEKLLDSWHQDVAEQRARLDSVLNELKALKGDVRRGQSVFNNPKAACITCHSIGYQGGHVGPDLTKISEVRAERDLLEAILYPSASFVRSFEPMMVSTRDGEMHTGILKEDSTAESLHLVTGPGVELRLAASQVQEVRPGSVSIMPAGLDQQLSRQELADLLVFLRNTRWGAE